MRELGKFFYQLAGYSYAGVVLTVALDVKVYGGRLLTFGLLITISLAVMGAYTLFMSDNKRKRNHGNN